jgi:Na+/phosphate symporter
LDKAKAPPLAAAETLPPDAPQEREMARPRLAWSKVGLFLVSLFLFLLALTLMKEGAGSLTPLLYGRFAITSLANSAGFGWLFACVIMSGSPVAAAALTFFSAGLINQGEAFAMITGSRLGSSFIVLLIGFLYVLRGRDKVNSLSMGLLSMTVTLTIHLGAFLIGIILLRSALLERVQPQSGVLLTAVTDLLFDPIVAFAASVLPLWVVFLLGLAIILFSFSLFDRCLPQMSLRESQFGYVSRLVYRPLVMFLLGAALTLISMSVSVSLSILVPLSHRGFIRRENVIPYIMGANVTTFIDTLLAAILLNDAATVAIVLAQMAGVTLVSILILAAIFRPYERILLRFTAWVAARNRRLAFFMLVIIGLPVLLILL